MPESSVVKTEDKSDTKIELSENLISESSEKTTMNIAPPRAINVKENQADNWMIFRKQWENFEIAADLAKKPEPQRVAILKTCIGEECFRILLQLNISTEVDKTTAGILDALENHFKPKVNIRYERFVFNTTKQNENEGVDSYVCRLRELIKSCSYPAEHEEDFICDRLIPGVMNTEMQRRLLMETDLTLKSAINICRLIEQTTVRMKALTHEDKDNTFEANQISSNYVPKHQFSNARNINQHTKKTYNRNNCNYCGALHAKGKCPAYGAICKKCGKMNHFGNVCRSQNTSYVKKTQIKNQNRVNEIHNAATSEEETDEEDIFLVTCIESSNKNLIMRNMNIISNKNKIHTIECIIDTGASCNIINMNILKQITGDSVNLNKTKKKLKSYSGHSIIPIGAVNLVCESNGKSVSIEFQVINEKFKTIIGARSSQDLDIIRVNHIEDKQTNQTTNLILKKYADVFKGEGMLPVPLKLEIDPSVCPSHQQPRRIPVALRSELENKLEDLERKGIISKVEHHTPWISNLLLIKKNNKLRICLDPTELNKALLRVHYQIPTIEEMLPNLTNAKIFSKLDAKNGFWQVPLDKESRELTTFWTPSGRYCWNRMPFGIAPAPEYFQKLQHEILHGLKGVEVIADDILVYGKGLTEEEAQNDHDQNLEKVLERVRQYNLKLNSKKNQIGLKKVTFFGHLLTDQGLEVDQEKIIAIREMPPPTDVASTQRFLGMCTYLSKFLPNLSKVSAPLRKICRENEEWKWTSEEEQSFNEMKQMLTKVPVLRYFNVNKDVQIQCDASKDGLGAVLLQEGHPISYASRTLTKTEQHYAQIEKECLAILFACKRFNQYICAKKNIVVESDHLPLQTIFKKSILKTPKRLQRMRLSLQRYDIKIKYKKGKEMYLADTLSRAVAPQISQINAIEDLHIKNHRLEIIKHETLQDPTLQKLTKIVSNGWPPEKHCMDDDISCYWNYREDITLQDGILLKGDRIIVPNYFEVDELTNLTASSVIRICKKNFSRHGIPQTVVSDGGTAFINKEFKQFADDWEFQHSRSSPHHQEGNCFWKMLLEYRNTENQIGSSPNQRLMSRRTRGAIPIINEKLRPSVQSDVKNKIIRHKQQTKKYHDRSIKKLPPLEYGQDVLVQLKRKPGDNSWTKGSISEINSDRTATVEVNGEHYLRNRKHILQVPENSIRIETDNELTEENKNSEQEKICEEENFNGEDEGNPIEANDDRSINEEQQKDIQLPEKGKPPSDRKGPRRQVRQPVRFGFDKW